MKCRKRFLIRTLNLRLIDSDVLKFTKQLTIRLSLRFIL